MVGRGRGEKIIAGMAAAGAGLNAVCYPRLTALFEVTSFENEL